MTDDDRLKEMKAHVGRVINEGWSITACAPDDICWLIAELEKAREETKRAMECAHREGGNALAQREKIKRLIDNLGPCDLGDQEGMLRRSRVNKFFNPRGAP